MGTVPETLKLGFPLFHSRRQSSVTCMHSIGGRDISQKKSEERRNPSGDLERRRREWQGCNLGDFHMARWRKYSNRGFQETVFGIWNLEFLIGS